MMRIHGFLRAVPALLAMLALGACGAVEHKFPPACPVPSLRPPLDEITRYNGAQDLRNMVVRARVHDVAGKCEWGDKGIVVATVQVVVDAQRGPAMTGDAISLPVFVAVIDGSAVRDEQRFYMPVVFQPNIDTVRALSKGVRMELPITPQKSAAAYNVLAGFQLSPEEVAAWRRDRQR
jgi:hypothetical protein